jgi:hypothetical protein
MYTLYVQLKMYDRKIARDMYTQGMTVRNRERKERYMHKRRDR